MKRRLDLAAALVHNPDVLFLDEPTTGLDPVSRTRVWEEVRRLNTQLGMTIFLTTQYLEEADELADRVGIINEGKLVAEGAPADLKRAVGARPHRGPGRGRRRRRRETQSPGSKASTASRSTASELTAAAADGAAIISPVAVALSGCGVTVQELTLRTPTLDDVFLELTGNRIQTDGEEVSQ